MGLFGFKKRKTDTESPESKMQRAQGLYQQGCTLFNQKNYKEAMPLIIEAAELGLSDAQNHLGVDYRLGEGVPKNVQKGIEWYRKAAAQGNAKAQVNLGQMYKKGTDLPRDIQEAVRLFRLSAEQGYPKAQTHLGILYEKGEGVEQSYSLAAMWYEKAADQGFAMAQFFLGHLYSEGLGRPQSIVEARLLWEASAAQGHKQAQQALAQFDALFSAAVDHFEKAKPTVVPAAKPQTAPAAHTEIEAPAQKQAAVTEKSAMSWYNKSHNDDLLKTVLNTMSADKNTAPAPVEQKAAETVPVAKKQPREPFSQTEILLQDAVAAYNAGNMNTALEHFKKAGEAGHAYAAYLAAEFYLLPEMRNYANAEIWATKAEKLGYQRATSLLQQIWADAGAHYLCEHEEAKEAYISKNINSQDFDKLWEEAPNCPEAKYAITLATAYLGKSAKAGNVSSMIKLAHHLYWKYSNLDELGEAEHWILCAEQTGDPLAHQLAEWICRLYYDTMGRKYAETDVPKATTYFKKGAQRGDPGCMLNLAIVLYNNTRDRTVLMEALQWATEAEKKGHPRTTELIQAIKSRL